MPLIYFFKYRGFKTEENPSDLPIDPSRLNIRLVETQNGIGLNPSFIQVFAGSLSDIDNTDFILAHEVGHVLGLLHPSQGTDFIIDNFINSLECSGNITNGKLPFIYARI